MQTGRHRCYCELVSACMLAVPGLSLWDFPQSVTCWLSKQAKLNTAACCQQQLFTTLDHLAAALPVEVLGRAHCAITCLLTLLLCAPVCWIRVHGLACVLAAGAKKLGLSTVSDTFFDTLTIKVRPGWAYRHIACGCSKYTHVTLNASVPKHAC